jgi:hypothetical protein
MAPSSGALTAAAGAASRAGSLAAAFSRASAQSLRRQPVTAAAPRTGYDWYFDWQRLRDQVLIRLTSGEAVSAV